MTYFNSLVDKIVRSSPRNNTLANKSERVSPTDITVCLGIRVSDIAPWILERLKFALAYYNPAPKFLIVDLGSEPEFAERIQSVCDEYNNATYLYVDDKDTFALAKARNIAGRYAETPYLLFSDVDFVYERNAFQRFANLAEDLEINHSIRRMLFMPIYHVEKEATEEFEQLESFEEKQKFIQTMSFLGQQTPFKSLFEFIAPYSNAFLIHKDFFNLSGGYCDEFRGHGSEDFDYLIRLGLLSTNTPFPELLNKDFYGPLKDSFFGVRNYAGFRRYLEVLTAPSESLGLKAFHMWHEKPAAKGYWTAQNDWKRERFNQIIDRYYPQKHNIINVDFHPRDKKALCIFSDTKSWGYFLPLRMYGYQLTAFTATDDDSLIKTMNAVENHEYDRIFIFNPYMKSHAKFRGILELARKTGVEITVVERGGLPNSIYYAPEVAYGDSDYQNLDAILATHTLQSEATSQFLIDSLRSGNEFLEKQDAYESTWKKHVLLRNSALTKVFIPLQLHDDMAVTKFTDGYAAYADFYEEINQAASTHPEVLFLIKRHPLSKENFNTDLENVVFIEANVNIYTLIDICDATIAYNSGVGLLSVIHNKPTFNIGNAYYTTPSKFSNSVNSIEEALLKLKAQNYHTATEEDILTFVDWLINCKYSWFTATSIIREFDVRKAHAYDDIVVERICLDGVSKNCGSRYFKYPFSTKSYLGWKTMLNTKSDNKQDAEQPPKQQTQATVKQTPPSLKKSLITTVLSACMSAKKANKLKKNPQRFFDDSKSSFIKSLRKFYIK